MRVSRLFTMCCLALAACSGDPSRPVEDVEVRVTDVRTNGTVPGTDVVFRVRNEGPARVFLASCGPAPTAAIDRWEGGRWVPVHPEGCLLQAVFPPLELSPGEEVSSGGRVDGAGLYRLRPGVSSRADERPDWNLSSTEFAVL